MDQKIIKLFESKNWAECIKILESAEIKNDETYALLGSCYQFTSDEINAIKNYRSALTLNPDNVNANHNLANILSGNSSTINQAILHIKKAIELDPENSKFLFSGLSIFQKAGKKEESVTLAIAASLLFPSDSLVITKAAVILIQEKKTEAALKIILEALKTNATDTLLLNLLAEIYQEESAIDAISMYSRIIEIDPDNLIAIFCLGKIYADKGPYHKAKQHIENYLQKEKDEKQKFKARQLLMHSASKSCEWDDVEELLKLINQDIKIGQIISPFMFLSVEDNPASHLEKSKSLCSILDKYSEKFEDGEQQSHDKIKIGYISGDFYNHATMNLMKYVFPLHDRNKFEVFGISLVNKEDKTRREVVPTFDHFIDISSLNSRDRIRRIRSLSLDVAIDLKGHTQDSDMSIFYNRVAKYQIAYLGYPGSSGVENMDYILGDELVTPLGSESYFSEKIIRMPHSYQVNNINRSRKKSKKTRLEYGLPESAFVFNNFNQNYKITKRDIALWSKVMARVENSCMWLMSTSKVAENNIIDEFRTHGILPDRIVFASRVMIDEHLARHEHADLLLDTLIYNAHTTGSDALWYGVPMVTLPGKSFASRVGSSLLSACGLEEMIAADEESYVDIAVSYATNENIRKKIRDTLGVHNAQLPLFDTIKWTKDFESLVMKIAK